MSQADALYRATCLDILEHGVWDTEQAVRPRWEDGTPAHTHYDLAPDCVSQLRG